jgi:ABC-2 type transport system ATP-binding protein
MITIKDLSFAYPKKEKLFRNLAMELKSGSVTGLLGTNGAGKTTFLKLLAGLLAKSGGQLKVNGFDPFDRQVGFLNDMYFIPEEYYLDPVKISNYVRANSAFYPRFDQGKFYSILKDFMLNPEEKLNELSHGQKKKFLVTFALATNCRLLVLDEPTNGLDIPSKSLFRKIVAGSIDEHQLVIISTHQVKDVENLIDNIVVLKDGTVVFHENTGTISEKLIFNSSRTIEEEKVLYFEQVPGGYKSIAKQLNGHPSEIDIELLFNAINQGKQLISEENE